MEGLDQSPDDLALAPTQVLRDGRIGNVESLGERRNRGVSGCLVIPLFEGPFQGRAFDLRQITEFIVPTSGDSDNLGITAEELIEYTREQLASYKKITRVEFVTELPSTATGKVQKFELRSCEWKDEDRLIGEG